MKERLQKILSSCGVCSRRAAEEYIRQGRVTVNGMAAILGDRADLEMDHIALDGAPVTGGESRTYLMLNKPRGYVTTLSDERGRKTVAQLIDCCGTRVWPVGRLDIDSEGLLLFTNDGELTNKLLHPSYQVEKEYLTWVDREPTFETLRKLSRPMSLDNQILRPAKVARRGKRCLSIMIHEGKNRQVRRMCAAVGLRVTRLKRIREGPLNLGELPVGQWRVLSREEISLLGGE